MSKYKTLKRLEGLGKRLGFIVPELDPSPSKEFLYAVRSSDSSEDTKAAASAGKFDSLLFVEADKLDEAVQKVRGKADGHFIQRMVVNPDWSFVGVSVNGEVTRSTTDFASA